MRQTLKKWLRRLLPIAVLGLPIVQSADAQVVQPVYTRPSKGSALTVFNTANPSGTETSAVFDMSAFAEVQLDVAITQTGGVTSNKSFGVSELGRYIKIQVTYDTPANDRSAIYTVLGSDSPTGTFVALDGPGSLQVIRPNPSLAMTNAKLVMTPLPYATTQYTRPSKGESITVLNTTLGQFTPVFPSTPVMDMRGFASVGISVVYSGASCSYGMNIFVYGSSIPTEASMRVLPTTNSVRTTQITASYVVNVASDYMLIGGSNYPVSGGIADCLVTVIATPLPYGVSDSAFPRTARFTTFYTLDAIGTEVNVANNERYSVMRIQNLGAGAASCGPPGGKVIRLAGETAVGNGATVTLEGYAGSFVCSSVGGVATQIGFFNY